jgi:hypothetical protein
MTATQTIREIRPALTMTHRTREECEGHASTQLWMAWADRFGYRHYVAQRDYYNLPAQTMESFDSDDHRPSEYYWELHIEVPTDADVPSGRAAAIAKSVDEMISRHAEIRQRQAEWIQRAVDQIRANAPAIVEAYQRKLVFPRRDRQYVREALVAALLQVLPGSVAVTAVSGSYISPDQLAAAVGVELPC